MTASGVPDRDDGSSLELLSVFLVWRYLPSVGRDDLADDLELAQRLASAAAAISLASFGRGHDAMVKADGTKITEADRQVEEELRRILANERPDDGVLGEEFGRVATTSGREWIIDPIDGTNSFIEGHPTCGTLIALRSEGRLTVGVVDQPVADRRSWASAGRGAFRRERGVIEKMRVSTVRSINGARSTPVPSDAPNSVRPKLEAIWQRVKVHEPPTRLTDLDHPGLLVATGRSDFALTFGQPWDIAAIAIIVREAGGRYGAPDGTSRIDSGCAIFSNGLVHDEILEAVRT